MVACIVLLIMKTSPKIKDLSSAKPAVKEKTGKEHSFIDRVFEIARKIPKGRVTSYGAIAESAGIRLSARMVGWAMHAAGSASKPVPAHRVVNSKGLLTGKHHFATPTLMQELLENEGIRVKDDQVQDFKKVFWDPQEEMRSVKKTGADKQAAIKPAAKATAGTKDKVKKAAASKQIAIKPTGKATSGVKEKTKSMKKSAAARPASKIASAPAKKKK